MPKVAIDKNRCKGCELCILYCPKEILEKDKELNIRGVLAAVPKKKPDKECTGCKFCTLICPEACIKIWKK